MATVAATIRGRLGISASSSSDVSRPVGPGILKLKPPPANSQVKSETTDRRSQWPRRTGLNSCRIVRAKAGPMVSIA